MLVPLSSPVVTATRWTLPPPSTTATCTPRESATIALDGTRTTWCVTATSSETSTNIPARSSPLGFGRSTSVRNVREVGIGGDDGRVPQRRLRLGLVVLLRRDEQPGEERRLAPRGDPGEIAIGVGLTECRDGLRQRGARLHELLVQLRSVELDEQL